MRILASFIVINAMIFLTGCNDCNHGVVMREKLEIAKTKCDEPYYIDKNVVYLPRDYCNLLDVYLPRDFFESKDKYPAVVNIHGGGWHEGNKEKGIAVECAQTLASHGYVVFTIDYLLNTKEKLAWPTNLEDCQAAVHFAMDSCKKYKVDPDRIGIIGNSAGGHLALLTTFTLNETAQKNNTPVKCVVDMYGISDVRLWGKEAFAKPNDLNAEEIWKKASPILYVNPQTVPVMALHGNKDDIVPISQSEILVEKLQEFEVEHEFVVVDGGYHGFTPYWRKADNTDLQDTIANFMDKHLK